MNGIFRFVLFVAVVVAIGLGVYANDLRGTVDKQRGIITSLTADRDSWKGKFDQQQAKGSQDAASLKQAQAQIADLQAQLEEAKKPPQPRLRRR